MRVILFVLFLFFDLLVCIGQTKNELINGIIKLNLLDYRNEMPNDYIDSKSVKTEISNNNYENFLRLKDLLSHDELVELVNHKNDVLRLYAIGELISQNSICFNLKQKIIDEIALNTKVQTYSGCIISQELTYSIVYHDYWNQIRLNVLRNKTKAVHEIEVQLEQALQNDRLLQEINAEIIEIDKDLYWLIYQSIFDVGRLPYNLKDKIIQMLFKYNNSYAFEYIKNYVTIQSKLYK